MNTSSENTYLLDDQVIIRVEFDTFSSINHFILIILGIPLNLIIVAVIFSSKRLKRKPRNILFLGVSTASLFTLFTLMFELTAHHHQSPIFCKMTGLGLGAAYTCLLNNMLLALIDRYLAIVSPLFHRKIVTVKSVWIIQIFGGIIIFISIKWPYLFGFAPLQCGFLMFEAKTLATQQAIMIFSCVILYILVYLKTKRFARPNRVVSVPFVSSRPSQLPPQQSDSQHGNPGDGQVAISLKSESNHSQHREIAQGGEPSYHTASSIVQNTSATIQTISAGASRRMKPIESDDKSSSPPHQINQGGGHPPSQQQQGRSDPIHQNTPSLQVHGGSRRMEIEATYTLLSGVSSLLIFSAPTVIVGFIDWGCRLILSDVEHQGQYCSKIMVSMPYLREFLFYHLVYNPIMYMIRNREFSSTLTEKWSRILHRHHQPQFISDGAIRNRIIHK